MGTRGKFGFLYKGKYYMSYNHLGSYPSCLGVDLILELLHADFDEWIMLLENIKEIDISDDTKPTPEDIKKLEKYTDLTIGRQSTEDWGCLLAFTEGSFANVLNCGYIRNVEGVCQEFSYVLDFDNKVFRAEGGNGLNVTMNLEPDELVRFAREWSKDKLDEDYSPEKKMAKMKGWADLRRNDKKFIL